MGQMTALSVSKPFVSVMLLTLPLASATISSEPTATTGKVGCRCHVYETVGCRIDVGRVSDLDDFYGSYLTVGTAAAPAADAVAETPTGESHQRVGFFGVREVWRGLDLSPC